MSTTTISWRAPITPGKAMMGLQLGMTIQQVTQALLLYRVNENNSDDIIEIKFDYSPILSVKFEEQAIILLNGEKSLSQSENPEEMLVLGFRNNLLVHIMAMLTYGADLKYYEGQLFGEIGFNSPVSAITKYCQIEFDDGDELFYPIDESCQGFSIGGSCCSLADDPDQTVSYIRIYKK